MPGLGDNFASGLDDWQRIMQAGGQLPPSQGFPQQPATDAQGQPIVNQPELEGAPIEAVRKIGDLAKQAFQAARADPAPEFTQGAAPLPAIPGLPKTLRENVAALSAQRNDFDPVDFMLQLGGGPGGGAQALMPFIGGAMRGGMSSTGIARQLAAETLPASPRISTEAKIAAPYVYNPQRAFSPGVYKDPRTLAAEAVANIAPEHPAMKQLFGVNREELAGIGQFGTRPGNIEPQIATVANPKGSYAAENIMQPANAQRLVDQLAEAGKYPQLTHGMDNWYVMDPAYRRMEQLVGPEQAKRDYMRFNTIVPMFSPASNVMTELNRGTAANMMAAQGRFPEFAKFAGIAEDKRGPNFPADLRDVVAHAYHKTSQAGPVGRYLESGVVDMTQPKVPLYMQASGVPETGFQTKLPVPDAHFTRGVGMADVRQNAHPGVSMKTPEYAAFGPWYRQNVAEPLGLQAVPAQGRQWGLMAPQTGVDTAVGAPKLELLSQRIWERAQKLGIDPYKLRDDVLLGKAHALWMLGLPAIGAAAAGAGSNTQPEYQ
jgi:hypothetical protein